MGQVLQGGAGQNPARQAAFGACLDKTVTAETINRVCGSGMRGDRRRRTFLIRAASIESSWQAAWRACRTRPYILRKARGGYRMGNGVLEDMMIARRVALRDRLRPDGTHGDNVAAEIGIGREEQDAWALRSHQRAIAALERGVFAEEIVPVEIARIVRAQQSVDTDEAPRRDTSAEALARS